MKVKRIQWLVVVSLAFAVFVLGLFGFRNLNRTPVQTYTLRTEADSGQTSPDAETAAGTVPAATDAAEYFPVNINTATLEQLDTLPGIGPVLAQSIIDYREANGPFTSVLDLMNVSGIGEKKVEAIWDLVTVEGA